MKPRPLYIFDLDGTLSDCSARRPLLDDLDDRKRWMKFHDRCAEDLVNEPVRKVMDALLWTGAEVWFWSGRPHRVRELTLSWLSHHVPLMTSTIDVALRVRDPGDDSRPDEEVKREWWERFTLPEDRTRLVCVFDDRDRIVAMWRNLGVTCLQVAPGDF